MTDELEKLLFNIGFEKTTNLYYCMLYNNKDYRAYYDENEIFILTHVVKNKYFEKISYLLCKTTDIEIFINKIKEEFRHKSRKNKIKKIIND